MTAVTTAQVVNKGIDIAMLQGVAQPKLAIPGQALDPPAKPSVLVMHYDLGTLD